MTQKHNYLVVAAVLTAAALVGCGRSDDDGAESSSVPTGIDFLLFPNPQAGLGIGNYDVVADNDSGAPINYTLTIVSTDGGQKTASGTLPDPSTNIVLTTFEQKIAGGVTIVMNTGGASARLRLCVSGIACTTAAYIAGSPADQAHAPTGSAPNPNIDLARFGIDSIVYAQEYYKAVDPQNTRATLAGFKTANSFGSTCNPNGVNEFEVRFRDVLDLGYGRHMCARGDPTANPGGDIAFWVENFQVTAIPGVKYGPLNLEAVVTDDRRWHIGTNAIEYSANPNGSARILKFYTFNPDGTRRLLVDLDGRGAKAMPIPCISCHGGRAPPLLTRPMPVLGGAPVESRFPNMPNVPRGGTLARMQPINIDTLDFAYTYPYRRSDQENSLKMMNRLVLCTYPRPAPTGQTVDDCREPAVNNEWQGTNAEMIKAWYGPPAGNMPNAVQSDTYLPAGWNPGTEENIYRTVVAPNCRVCHSLRGNVNQSDIDFTTYAKFSSYADQIKHHVYDKGNMPLALLKFDHFWESTAPATLSAIVPGSTASNGSVLTPTRSVAKAGPDRVVLPGTTKLSAAESINATSYNWSTSSPCSFAAGENTKVRPTLTTLVGTCTVQLVVSDGTTNSDPDTLTVVVSASAPSGTTFSGIVTNILRAGGPGCAGCHNSSTPQIPLYYAAGEDYDSDGDVDDAADMHQLYLNVRARINFMDIENSPLLRKPTNFHHCGGDRLNDSGLPGDAGRVLYDTLLNWILAGAPQ